MDLSDKILLLFSLFSPSWSSSTASLSSLEVFTVEGREGRWGTEVSWHVWNCVCRQSDEHESCMEEDAAMWLFLAIENFANLVIKWWNFFAEEQVLGLSS